MQASTMTSRRVPSVIILLAAALLTIVSQLPGSALTATSRDRLTVVRAAIQARQLGSHWTERVLPDGRTVQGQVTLDLCGGRFASEALRSARLQLALSDQDTGQFISNEVVTYTDGGAAVARRELIAAAAACPHRPVASPVVGVPPATYRLRRLARRRGWLPTALGFLITRVDTSGRSGTEVAIYQFRGRVLSVVYGPAPRGAATAATLRATAAAARRLSALPPGAV